ncbi:hypothetical protein ABG067_000424 [Albugo candida]
MSLICGSLSWLYKNTDSAGLLQENDCCDGKGETGLSGTEEPAWLASYEHSNISRHNEAIQSTIETALEPIRNIRQRSEETLSKNKRKVSQLSVHKQLESHGKRFKGDKTRCGRLSTDLSGRKNDDLVSSYDSDGSKRDDRCEPFGNASAIGLGTEKGKGVMKIFYCSRTHSQISQFVREMQKTVFGKQVRVVTLGSRKLLCIHPRVSKLNSDIAMMEGCLDLLRHVKKRTDPSSASSCAFYNPDALDEYKNYALAHLHDIEDLHQLGQELAVCPYYGTRQSLDLAQVVALPYTMILSAQTRESLGIDLKDNIIIFDEAHNILETVQDIHRAEIDSTNIVKTRRCLWRYLQKYESRLKGQNSYYINQLLAILERLGNFLRHIRKVIKGEPETSKSNIVERELERQLEGHSEVMHKMLRIGDFLCEADLDHFNLFKLIRYLDQSDLPKKLIGFVEKLQTSKNGGLPNDGSTAESDETELNSRYISPLRTLQSFLQALINNSIDGRILVKITDPFKNISSLQYLLLNPSHHFEDIVKEARAVIFAGGTMQPVQHLFDQLLPSVPREKIDVFCCGHVIPPTNLMGLSLSTGPTRQILEFNYARRNSLELFDELGRILFNFSKIVPGGIVVFFPSYKLEATIVNRWRDTAQYQNLEKQKKIFREPKRTDESDRILKQYSDVCKSKEILGHSHCNSGAILLSVVGGKMSEGINFSDELARCVVMVGLPYPNAADPELLEKMAYLDTKRSGEGRKYYETLCMKAVNQSIGTLTLVLFLIHE